MGSDFNPAKQGLSGAPALAPPMFIDHKEKVFLAQTPAILAYLGPKLGLAGNTTSSADAAAVQTLTLTFLDLNNEAHDVHHPIAVSKYYEDQKPAAVERAKDFRENRGLFWPPPQKGRSLFRSDSYHLYHPLGPRRAQVPWLRSARHRPGWLWMGVRLPAHLRRLDPIPNHRRSSLRFPKRW